MNLKQNDNFKNIELPYEKCVRNGASVLTDIELMAVILRCGTNNTNVLELANELITKFCNTGKLNTLLNVTYEELISIKGIGRVKAAQLLSILELSKRICKEPIGGSIILNSPEKVANLYMSEMRILETEHVFLLLLDSKNGLIKKIVLSSGSINASVLEAREVYVHALRHNATGIILLHNHPSGNPTPSKADEVVTLKILEAGTIIGINLIDHIIIGDNKFISLKDEGLII